MALSGILTFLSWLLKSFKENIMFNCSELHARDLYLASCNWFWICLLNF